VVSYSPSIVTIKVKVKERIVLHEIHLRTTGTMALSCIICEIKRDIGQKL